MNRQSWTYNTLWFTQIFILGFLAVAQIICYLQGFQQQEGAAKKCHILY